MQSSKTRKFLIATHGTLATGLKSSLNLIVGAVDNVFLIEAYVDENKALEDEINEVLKQVGDQDELLIFSDILGGSVTNQLLQFALRPNVYIVSGFNLPLVIELVLGDTDTPLEELIEESITNAKQQMVFVNKLVAAANNEEHND